MSLKAAQAPSDEIVWIQSSVNCMPGVLNKVPRRRCSYLHQLYKLCTSCRADLMIAAVALLSHVRPDSPGVAEC